MAKAFAYALLSLLVAFPSAAIACQCTADLFAEQLQHPRTERQTAEAHLANFVRFSRFSHGATIFEGTVEMQEVLTAPALPEGFVDNSGRRPEYQYRLVTIRATRVYRGPREEKFAVRTGMGNGDCGFDFETGGQYIVFAYHDREGKGLSTNWCTDTGSLEDSGAMLRVLRGEAPAPEDLLNPESYHKRNRSHWGSVCGRVAVGNKTPVANFYLYLIRERHDGIPPLKNVQVSKPDGTYCFDYLRSGTYFLSGEDYDSNTYIRLRGSLSENGHSLPILVEVGKTVGNVDLVLHEDFRDWVYAVLGVIAAVATLTLITFWLVRREARRAS